MKEIHDSAECSTYLREVAEGEGKCSKPFPCSYLAVLKEEFKYLGNIYGKGVLMCSNPARGIFGGAPYCRIQESSIKPHSSVEGVVCFTAKCTGGKINFTLEIKGFEEI